MNDDGASKLISADPDPDRALGPASGCRQDRPFSRRQGVLAAWRYGSANLLLLLGSAALTRRLRARFAISGSRSTARLRLPSKSKSENRGRADMLCLPIFGRFVSEGEDGITGIRPDQLCHWGILDLLRQMP